MTTLIRRLPSLFVLIAAAAVMVLAATSAYPQGLDPALIENYSQLTPEEKTKLLHSLKQESQGENSVAPNINPLILPVPRSQYENKQLKPFGYDIFDKPVSTFAPVKDIPVPNDYVLGPGDTFKVQLFGKDNRTLSLSVSRNGEITFPELGPIIVSGLRFEDARGLIEKRINKEMIGVQVNVTLGQLRSIQIFLLGDVYQPGAYTVSALSTITNALFSSGGISLVGSLRRVQLKRSGQLIRQLDLYDLLLRGDSSADTRLQPGDVIFIPPVGAQFTVAGEIKRPAIYEIRDSISVQEALSLAGGLSAASEASTAQIERIEAGGQRRLSPLTLSSEAELQQAVRDGDRIIIRRVADVAAGRVYILGPVKYPGNYPLQKAPDLRSLILQTQINQLNPLAQPYLLIGLIEHTAQRTGVRSFKPFTAYQVLRDSEPPVALEDGDRVLLFTRSDIGFLQSAFVRRALQGDPSVQTRCRSLAELVKFSSHQRAANLVQSFASDQSVVNLEVEQSQIERSKKVTGALAAAKAEAAAAKIETAPSKSDAASLKKEDEDIDIGLRICPQIFEEAPSALTYLLDQSVGVFGEVQRQGLYPVARMTDLNTVLEAAGGLTREANGSTIEFLSYRTALEKGASVYQTLDLSKTGSLERLVEPGDVLTVRARYTGQEAGTVQLSGEFRLPGRYTILRGETLTQLFARAGGLTEFAYPYGAVLTRESAKKTEAQSLKRATAELQDALVTTMTSGALAGSSGSASDFLKLLIAQVENAKPVGRIVVEADPTVIAARPSNDIRLDPGDEIFIPKRPSSVTVTGQVLSAGSVAFNPGASAADYIESSGGFTPYADKGHAFVVYPNGQAKSLKLSFWNFRDETVPPGSYIVIPRETPPVYSLFLTEKIAGIFSNLAISAAALSTLNR